MPLLQSFGPLHSPPTSAPFGFPAGGGVTPFACSSALSGEITEQATKKSAARDPRTVVFIVPMMRLCNFVTLLDEVLRLLNHCAICAILHCRRWIVRPPIASA